MIVAQRSAVSGAIGKRVLVMDAFVVVVVWIGVSSITPAKRKPSMSLTQSPRTGSGCNLPCLRLFWPGREGAGGATNRHVRDSWIVVRGFGVRGYCSGMD